jgi:prepilin-type N-terminal cleavage/methylation domain-containing protein/prepilin-type processing-associated H-X9-DG protein
MKPTQRNSAFTLIELLVVIAIIAILAAILFPVFAQAKNAAKKTADLSNIKQVSLGTIMYAGDFDDAMPIGAYLVPPPGSQPFWVVTWRLLTQPYIKSNDLFSPPNFKRGQYAGFVALDYASVYEDNRRGVPLGLAGTHTWAAPWYNLSTNMTSVPRPANLIAISTSRFMFSDVAPWTVTNNWFAGTPQYPGQGTFVAYAGKANFAYFDGHAKSTNPCATFGRLDFADGQEPSDDFQWDWKPFLPTNEYRRFIQGDQPGSQPNDYGCVDIQEYR